MTHKCYCIRWPAQCRTQALRLLLCALALGLTGCLRIETHVKLDADGSAVLTERIWFSERLMDLAGSRRGEIKALLGRERQIERMNLMGSGLTLLRHELREGGDGWVESVAEISTPDINKLRYASPWLAHGDYATNNRVRLRMVPMYKSNPHGSGDAGNMSVSLAFDTPPRGGSAPRELTPMEQQVYRDISPVVRDMLRGFRLAFTFESYAPVRGVLGNTLLDVSDTNLDQMGQFFFENEEIMLELARMNFGGPNVAANVFRNPTLPTFLPLGSRAMWHIPWQLVWFPPSQPLFDRYFAGKKLDFARWQASPPEQHKPALFSEIGWRPPRVDEGTSNRKPAPAGR